ncbi:MAG: undecaprenyldiphospho-muramoylpentapeptide beta-N-acetylglucosaminyltransferase [Christensenellaceae bacterium]|jgi:UDP-N-acetylglucosamine--N-acetylmuramyl-(pentapeptide) pyrophosphoryl-undecaprenol N-acetylglucosamine transferase|nr:undecaprenyldiphospho-muramoylpentapeptide beta-N-acetylglucosaminyltransferase [Christensenellaceae bacterium]
MAKTILLTGGGSAGHVTPNLALIPKLQTQGFSIHYVGTAEGIERALVEGRQGVTYHAVSAGKLRRYFSLKNFADPFRVLRGIWQARRVIREVQPDVVFSKGGYVSVPVVLAARGKAPIVTHESDYTPGLANKISARFATKICVTFEDTLRYTGDKGVYTGTPIRPELYEGDARRGRAFAGFSSGKPVLLVMGGSQGAQAVNEALRKALPALTPTFDIIHLCGKGKVDAAYSSAAYIQYEYISAELPDLLQAADIVLSRAGANSVFEFLALAKPALLVPLPLSASRGDQILNAGYFSRRGYALTLAQEEMTPQKLADTLLSLYENRLAFISAMQADTRADGTDEVLDVICGFVKG